MAVILNIETATDICSVAIAKDGELLLKKENADGKSHASLLTILIEEVLSRSNINFSDLNAVAVSMGPGSYTGLRIGVSVTKGICYAHNISLIAVNTLQSMALGLLNDLEGKDLLVDIEQAWYCPMIDARRMEVYLAFFDYSNVCREKVSADIIEKDSYKEILDLRPVIFFGNGSAKCKTIIDHPNAYFIDDILLSAKSMIALSEKAFSNKQFEDVAYFEPFYLKDFVATVSKKNLF